MSNILRAKFTNSSGIAFSEAPADSFVMFTESNEPLYFGKSNSSNYIAIDGSTKISNQLLVAKDILPITNATQSIGSSSIHFKEAWIDTVHISSNTLYLGNTPVLGTNQDSIQITADCNQSINIKTTGLGQTTLLSANGVNITTTGTNKNVDIQASGLGGSVLFGASTGQVVFTTPSTTFSSNVTVQGNTTVQGNFVVSGTTTTVNTTNLNVQDNIITLNANDTGMSNGGVSLGSAGLKVYRGDSADPYQIVFVEADDKLKVGFGNSTSNLVSVATEPFVHTAIAASNLATKSFVNTTITGSNLATQPFVHTSIATSNLATKSFVNTTISGSNLATQPFVHTAIATTISTSNLANQSFVHTAIATSNLATKSFVNTTISGSNLATQPFVHSVIATSNLATQPFVNTAIATTISGSNLANQSFVHTVIATSNLATKSYVNTTISGSNFATQPFVHSVISASNLATKAYVDASAPSGTLSSASNLSDLANATTARNNLGLGSANTVSFSSINAGLAYAIGNPISARNSSNITTASTIDNYPLLITSSAGTTGSTTGIALSSVTGITSNHTPGASITYERSSVATGFKGNMNFNVQTTSGTSNTLTTAMTIYNDGNVGIGTSNPTEKLHVDGNIIATGGFGENGNQVKTKTVNLINNQEGTSKMVFTRDQLSFKVIITSERSTLAQEYATYEEFEVIWNGRLDTPPKIYNHKYLISNRSSTVFLNRGKFFYDSVSGNFTIEHSRSTSNASVNVRAIFIGHVNHPTILTDTSIPSGAEITDIQGLCTIGNNSGTNVGIGTSNPTEKLHVDGHIKSTTGVLKLSSTALTNANQVQFNNDMSTAYTIQQVDNAGLDYFRMGRNGYSDVVVNSNGNVGIGTTAPTYKLHVDGNVKADNLIVGLETTYGNQLSVRATSNITNASVISDYPLVISVQGGTGYNTGIAFQAATTGGNATSTPGASIIHKRTGASDYRGNLCFNVQNTAGLSSELLEAMTILSSGSVGIGTSNPITKLHVVGDGNNDQVMAFNTAAMCYSLSNNGGGFGILGLAKIADNYSASAQANDLVLRNSYGNLLLQSGNTNAALIINSSNYVGIGTTAPASKLHVVGDALFTNDGSFIGDCIVSGVVKCATYETGEANMFFMIDSDSNSDNGTGFIWRANGTTSNLMTLSEDGDLLVSKSLYSSGTANAGTLGTSIRRWSTVYGVDCSFSGDGNFSGDCSVSGIVNCDNYQTTGANMVFMIDSDGNSIADSGFIWRANGNNTDLMRFSEDGNLFVLKSIYSSPTADAGTLGTSTRRWSTIYGGDGNFADSVTCGVYQTSVNAMVFMIDSDGNSTAGSGFVWRANGTTTDLMILSENAGNLTVKGTATANGVALTSDDRIKSDEVFIENATETLKKLRPQTYNKWTTIDYLNNSNATSVKESGLIAQEIFYDAPELRHLVTLPEGADSNALYSSTIQSSQDPSIDPDYKDWGSNIASVNYNGLIPYLIKAIQEKDEQIGFMQSNMTFMQSNIISLEARLHAGGL